MTIEQRIWESALQTLNGSVRRALSWMHTKMGNAAWRFTYSIAAEASENIDVTITAKTPADQPIEEVVTFFVALYDDAAGAAPNTDNSTLSATTGEVLEVVADKLLLVKTNASGVAVIRFNITGAATTFLRARYPGGSGEYSAAVTHA